MQKLKILLVFTVFLLSIHNGYAQDFWQTIHHFNNMLITGIVVDSAGHIYVSGNGDYPATRGVFRSDDDGVTWQQKNNDVCRSISIDKQSNIYTITNMACYKSSDHGETWHMVFAPDPFVPSNHIKCGFDSIVLAGGSYMNGILRSGDYGKTWQVVLSLDHNNEFIELITDFCFGTNGVCYASSITQLDPYQPSKIYASYNYGKTWQVFLSAIHPEPIYYPESMGFDNQGRLLVGQAGDGLYRYNFNTTTWDHPLANYSAPSDILVLPNDRIILAVKGYRGGVMLSEDGGNFYKYINSGLPDNPEILRIANDKAGRILVSDGSSIYRSIDTIYAKAENTTWVSNKVLCSPNPFHAFTSVSLPNQLRPEAGIEISVFNAKGQLVYTRKDKENYILEIDGSSFSNGLYSIVLKNGNKVYTQKLIHY